MSPPLHSTSRVLVRSSRLLCDRFEAAAGLYPNAIAIIGADQRVSYGDLSQRVNRLARLLITKGVGPGDVVAIAFESSIERLEAMLGVLGAGAAYLPLDTEAPPSRITALVRDAKASVVLSSPKLQTQMGFGRTEEVVIVGSPTTTDILAGLSGAPVAPNERIRMLKSSDLAYVLYTSGSTGAPKGVCVSHAAITTSLDWIVGELGVGASDGTVHRCDYTFDLSVWEIFSMLAFGGTLVLPKPGGARDSSHVAELIRMHGTTVFYAVPTMLSEFIESDGSRHCTSLKSIVCIGEALSGALQESIHARLPAIKLWNAYGPTEAAVGVTLWLCRREDGAKAPPIGVPACNTQIYLLDEALSPVAVGETGEIFIAGDYLARGYLGQAELTAERFIPSPFGSPDARMYRTGDLAERRHDGEIYFLGRNDTQVKFNGIRVELGEIEAAVAGLPNVARAAVIAREIGGESRLIAYVIMKPGAPALNAAEAKATLGRRLPRYLTPSFFVAVDRFCTTTSAKLDTRALPDPNPEDGQACYREPRGDLERFFADTFARLMGVARVGADDSFFDLGGTSLTAMRLAACVKAFTGRVLSMRSLVEEGTPAGLARAMRLMTRGDDVITDLPFDRRPIVFLLPGAGGSDLMLGSFAVACDQHMDMRILESPDWRSLCHAGVSFQSWAAELADRIVAQSPVGDINLAGYSLGGDLAYEIAQNLRRRGRRTGFLAIIDTDAPLDSGALGDKRPRSLWRRIARVIRDRELALAITTNSYGSIPVPLLPLLHQALSFGSAARREKVESRIVTTVGTSLGKAWRQDAARYSPLHAPTYLFRVRPNSLDEGRFDGWWDRTPNLICREVDGDHMSLLSEPNLHGFATTFIACAREALDDTRERREVMWSGTTRRAAAMQSAPRRRLGGRRVFADQLRDLPN